jgi:hypothetical protein
VRCWAIAPCWGPLKHGTAGWMHGVCIQQTGQVQRGHCLTTGKDKGCGSGERGPDTHVMPLNCTCEMSCCAELASRMPLPSTLLFMKRTCAWCNTDISAEHAHHHCYHPQGTACWWDANAGESNQYSLAVYIQMHKTAASRTRMPSSSNSVATSATRPRMSCSAHKPQLDHQSHKLSTKSPACRGLDGSSSFAENTAGGARLDHLHRQLALCKESPEIAGGGAGTFRSSMRSPRSSNTIDPESSALGSEAGYTQAGARSALTSAAHVHSRMDVQE